MYVCIANDEWWYIDDNNIASNLGMIASIEVLPHILFEVNSNSYFDISSDVDIGKVDPNYLFEVLIKKDLSNSDALFVSCTALPALSIIKELEKKLGKFVLSSNQPLIWDTLKQINNKSKIVDYGELFNN